MLSIWVWLVLCEDNMSEWQLIETCPINQDVLFLENGKVYLGVCVDYFDEDEKTYWMFDTDHRSNAGFPTHWMPLPASPIDKSSENQSI